MKLEFVLKRSYGRDRYYPCGAVSGVITAISGRKCLRDVDIQRLKVAGFTIALYELVGVNEMRAL